MTKGSTREKFEGLCVTAQGDIWVNNDNDGVDDNSGENLFAIVGTIVLPGDVSSPAEGPVDSPAEGPVDSPAESPVDAPSEGSVDTPVDGPVDAPAEGPVDAPVDGTAAPPTGSAASRFFSLPAIVVAVAAGLLY